jgi:hypothetical protein
MEVAALAGLLALGYSLTRASAPAEGFESAISPEAAAASDVANYGGLGQPLYDQVRTAPGAPTFPGKPRQPRHTADGGYDQYYPLPSTYRATDGTSSGTSNPLAATASGQPDLYPRSIVFASPAAPQAPPTSITPQVRMNNGNVEMPPTYNSGKTVISALTGVAMPADEFTHNNMTPFYRGSLKQNMSDSQNRSILDDHIGTGYTQIAKREQAPLFDPHREPVGNVTGLESMTDFMQDRMVAPTNRAGEVPVEPVRVAPGVNQGYSSFGAGGFQQFEINDIMRQRKSVDELRVESDPKITYEGVIVPGKSLALQRGELGETRKYRPDTFFLNQNGERNFVTAGENSKPTERAAQVFKYQTRQEMGAENVGPAGAADFKATYTVPSFRAPLVRQHDGFGYRNADGSTYGVSNTDAENNDFGRQGYDLPTNQRNVTSERGQALNLTVAGGPKALTVYDPADWTARTTVRETTGANDWIGIAASASAPTKLTVYDPTDIARVTIRNTTAEPDRAMNVTRAGMPGQGTLNFPDGVRLTTKGFLSAESDYAGSAGPAVVKNDQVYDYAYAMRQNPVKEIVSSGRKPTAGNGSLSLFNGEDYVNMSYRKPDTDSLNDRQTAVNRVQGPPLGVEAVGVQRAKQTLHLDIAADRNMAAVLDGLADNPYAMPVHKIAAGTYSPGAGMGPAAMAAMSLGSTGDGLAVGAF